MIGQKMGEGYGPAEDRALAHLKACAGEHFADYVILVRTRDGLCWRYNDRTWAKAACERLVNRIDSDDRLHAEDQWDPE